MTSVVYTFAVGQRVKFKKKYLDGTSRLGKEYEGEFTVEEVRPSGTLQQELGVGDHQLVRLERISWVSGVHLLPV